MLPGRLVRSGLEQYGPSGGVNFSALVSRFVAISCIRAGSHLTWTSESPYEG